MTETRTDREIPDLLASKREAIAALCREYGVAKLEVFGSVMTDEFDPARSDVDFIVDYLPGRELGWWAERYYELVRKLSDLVGREVDLVESRALSDPFFRHFANLTRTVFYDGADVVQVGAEPSPDRRSRGEDRDVLPRP